MSDLIERVAVLEDLEKRMADDYVDAARFAEYIRALPSAEPERIIKIGKRSGKALESAIDYLNSVGWLQEHDRILTESAEPERPKGEWVDGLPYVNSHWWVCSVCHVPAPENHTGYNFCPNCGSRMTRGE